MWHITLQRLLSYQLSEGPLVYLPIKSQKHKAELTGASVVAFRVPHSKVSHGAGSEAHTDLTDVIALQEDEELGLTLDAAIVLRASVTAFGTRWRPLSTNCGNRTGTKALWYEVAPKHQQPIVMLMRENSKVYSTDLVFLKTFGTCLVIVLGWSCDDAST